MEGRSRLSLLDDLDRWIKEENAWSKTLNILRRKLKIDSEIKIVLRKIEEIFTYGFSK